MAIITIIMACKKMAPETGPFFLLHEGNAGTNRAGGYWIILESTRECQMPPLRGNSRRREMTLLARARRRIQGLGPYQSLALLVVPLSLVEPLKLLALFVAGNGHWLTGTGMLVAAYAASLLLVERLFRVVKPKLLMLDWFAKFWTGVLALRNKVIPWRSAPADSAKMN